MNRIFYTLTAITLVIIMLFSSCSKKETQQNEIPVVAVNFSLDPNSTEYLELNHVSGSVALTGGYRGIIVYRETMTDFVAYERACPYDWNVSTKAQIKVDPSGITLTCPVCNSRFNILDGSSYSGPSPYPLKRYQTTYDGTLLYIYN
jgi:nitrite reductase/ring-hydroxylating ferredoxin subunit